MFDTNIFNKILDESFDLNCISPDMMLYVTRVQLDEINGTNNIDRRNRLNKIFEEVPQEMTGTDTFLVNESWINQDNIGSAKSYHSLLAELDSLKMNPYNYCDALIAETAINRGLCLVTNDKNLRQAALNHNGLAIFWNEFKEKCAGIT